MKRTAEFKLGVIGGCMSHQIGIRPSQLYHRRLAERLFKTSGVRLRVHIAKQFQHGYRERLDALLERVSVDGVLLHSRVTITNKAKLAPVYSSNGLRSYYIHPFLLGNRRSAWAQLEAEGFPGCWRLIQRRALEVRTGPAVFEQRPSRVDRALRGANRILGRVAGLDAWAIRDELREVREFADHCAARDVPFVVLGPTPTLLCDWDQRLIDRVNSGLRTFSTATGVPCILCDPAAANDGRRLLAGDGVHLTSEGHAYIAERLAEVLGPWILTRLDPPDDRLGGGGARASLGDDAEAQSPSSAQ